MNSFSAIAVLLSVCVCLMSAAPSDYYGAQYKTGYNVPQLPPFGAAARHPVYRHGYGGDYLTALRYESTSRRPYSIDSAYAYAVDGQKVQVARSDSSKYH